MKPFKTHDGYLRVPLKRDLNSKMYRVHRIVAETFLEDPKIELCINHIDGNKDNNHYSNLEYCTVSKNNIHKYKVLGQLGSKAKKVYQYDKQGNFIAEYPTPKVAFKETGVQAQNISKVCLGKRPLAGGYKWSY